MILEMMDGLTHVWQYWTRIFVETFKKFDWITLDTIKRLVRTKLIAQKCKEIYVMPVIIVNKNIVLISKVEGSVNF